jgi:hypothetical protein
MITVMAARLPRSRSASANSITSKIGVLTYASNANCMSTNSNSSIAKHAVSTSPPIRCAASATSAPTTPAPATSRKYSGRRGYRL